MNCRTTADPLNPWLTHTMRISSIRQETPGVATYDLQFTDPETSGRFSFLPGQFNMLYLPGLGEIAISISGDLQHPGCVPHTIREAGNVTRSLARLQPGATIGLRGPFGTSWPVEKCMGKDVVLVAGGIGLAPLRPVIYELMRRRSEFGRVVLIIGSRELCMLLYPMEYADWQAGGIDVHVTVDRPSADCSTADWSGNIGMVTAVLDRISMPNPSNTVLMTCGPEVMMWYTVQGVLQRGVPANQLFVSLERNMNCAIGLCGHCQFGAQFICKDGPVFAFDRVASVFRVDDL